jgi:hypothetical protein
VANPASDSTGDREQPPQLVVAARGRAGAVRHRQAAAVGVIGLAGVQAAVAGGVQGLEAVGLVVGEAVRTARGHVADGIDGVAGRLVWHDASDHYAGGRTNIWATTS